MSKEIKYDIVDPRSYPNEVVKPVEDALREVGLEGQLLEQAVQAACFWVHEGGNPSDHQDVVYKPEVQLAYSPGQEYGKLIRGFKDEIQATIGEVGAKATIDFNEYEKRRKEAIANGPRPTVVPGDPDFTDPSKGVAGLRSGWYSPEDPKMAGDNQALHYGPGYDN